MNTTGHTFVSGTNTSVPLTTTTTAGVPVTSTNYVQGTSGVGLVPVGHTERNLAAAATVGTAVALGAEHLIHKKRGHKVRNASISSASDYDEDVVERHGGSVIHRTNELLVAAVGRYIARKLLTKYKMNKVNQGEAVEEVYDPAQRAAILAIAQSLIQYKYHSHKYKEHAVDQVDENAIDSYRNKALIKSIAITALPFIVTQLKNFGSNGSNIVVDGVERPNSYGIKGIAYEAKRFIAGLGHQNRVGATTGVATTGLIHPATTTTTTTEVIGTNPTTIVGAPGVVRRSTGIRGAAGLLGRKYIRGRKTVVTNVEHVSSSSSEGESIGKGKKLALLGLAAGIAGHLVNKLNRRRQRKVVRREILVEKEPSRADALKSKLAAYRARSSSSSSSSSDEESRKKKIALLAAATAVAKKLGHERVKQRYANLPEQEIIVKKAKVDKRLARSVSASSSDEEIKTSGKNKTMLTAASYFVRRQLNKALHRDQKTVTTANTTMTTAPATSKRNALLKKAAAVGATYFISQAKARGHHNAASYITQASQMIAGPSTVNTTTTKTIGSHHRKRSISSSSSSSSSDDDHKKTKAAAAIAGATVARKMVHKLNRRQTRAALRKEIVVEKDPSRLETLKSRFAELRTMSPGTSSSSSDEESHKKSTILLAAATAAAGYLLKERLDHRRATGVITEQVYTTKLGNIDRSLAVGSYGTVVNNNKAVYTSSSSEDVAVAKQYRRRSYLLPARQLVNRLIHRNYKRSYRNAVDGGAFGTGYTSTVGTGLNTGLTTGTTSYETITTSTSLPQTTTLHSSNLGTGLTTGTTSYETVTSTSLPQTTVIPTTGLTGTSNVSTNPNYANQSAYQTGVVGGSTLGTGVGTVFNPTATTGLGAGLIPESRHRHHHRYHHGMNTGAGLTNTGLIGTAPHYGLNSGMSTSDYHNTVNNNTVFNSGLNTGLNTGLNPALNTGLKSDVNTGLIQGTTLNNTLNQGTRF